MPYPENLKTAKIVEAIVRENGAVPATIAIINGVPRIGLNSTELEKFASLASAARKTSRRDIAHVVRSSEFNHVDTFIPTFTSSKGLEQTKWRNHSFFHHVLCLAGISVFVTGGIGGVHRNGEDSEFVLFKMGERRKLKGAFMAAMDISSDLTELGRTSMGVVSAGAKSILDIPRTLEYLETQGVCVAGYKTDEFPAFFTESSGCKVPCRVDSPEDCARLIDCSMKYKLGGVLIAVPIHERHAASGIIIESAIQTAIMEAREMKISGNAETPFLLKRVNELTEGASLASNINLIKNNAEVGAKIAVAIARIRNDKL